MKTCFCHLTVVWRPLAEERRAISTQSIYIAEKYIYWATTPSLTIPVYLHSFSCCCLRNTRNVAKFQETLTLQQFKVIQGHRSWCQLNGKPMTSYLSIIVTLAVSATVFEIFTLKDRKLLTLPTPLVWRPRSWGTP